MRPNVAFDTLVAAGTYFGLKVLGAIAIWIIGRC